MKEKLAIATLAVASAFSGAAAEAHDHGHDRGGHRHGPGIELYVAPAPMYRAPPPGYYRQPAPPVYVVPQLPPIEVDCYDKTNIDRYGYPRYSGSVRTYQDQNTGGTFQGFTRQPCF